MSAGSKQRAKGSSTKSVNLNKIADLMAELGVTTASERPAGFTVDDYMKESGLKRSQASNVLRQLCNAGKLTRVRWQCGHGGRTYIHNYVDA